MKSLTSIDTQEGQRISKRLVNHWKHKFEIDESEHDFKIIMPTATVTLQPDQSALHVKIETQETDNTRLEGVVLDHLNRMAQQEFNPTWSHQS